MTVEETSIQQNDNSNAMEVSEENGVPSSFKVFMENLPLLTKCSADLASSLSRFNKLLSAIQKNEVVTDSAKLGKRPFSDVPVPEPPKKKKTIGTSTPSGSIHEDSANKKVKRELPYGLKKPLSSYLIFCREYREKMKNAEPHIAQTEIAKEMGKAWNSLNVEEKAKYDQMAADMKKEYAMQIKQKQDEENNGSSASGAEDNHAEAPVSGKTSPVPAASVSLADSDIDDFQIEKKAVVVADQVMTQASKEEDQKVEEKKEELFSGDEGNVPSSNTVPATPNLSPEEKERRKREKQAKKEKKMKKKLASANATAIPAAQ